MTSIFTYLVAALLVLAAANPDIVTDYDQKKAKGGKSNVVGGYTKMEREDLKEVEDYVLLIEDDIRAIMKVSDDCSVEVKGAQKQVVAGTNYIVDVVACKPDVQQAQIKFFVPLPSDDPEQKPKDCSKVEDETWTDVEDLEAVQVYLTNIDAELKKLLMVSEDCTITLTSATYTEVAGKLYRAVLDVKGVTMTIQFLVDEYSNVSSLAIYSIDQDVVDIDDLQYLQEQVNDAQVVIVEALTKAGYTVDSAAKIVILSATYEFAANRYVAMIEADELKNIEIEFEVDAEYAIVTDSIVLLTEPPKVVEYAAADGSQKMDVVCEAGYTLDENNICVKKAKKKDQLEQDYEDCNENELEEVRAAIKTLEEDIKIEGDIVKIGTITVEKAGKKLSAMGAVYYSVDLVVDYEDEDELQKITVYLTKDAKGVWTLTKSGKGAYSSAADGEKVKKDDVDKSEYQPCTDSMEITSLEKFVLENEEVIIAELELTNVKAISVEGANSKATIVGGVSYDIQLKIELEDGSIESAEISAVKSGKGVMSFVSNKKAAYSSAADGEKVKKDEVDKSDYQPCNDEEQLGKIGVFIAENEDAIIAELELTNVQTMSVTGADYKANAVGGSSFDITLLIDYEDGESESAVISAVKSSKGVFSLVSNKKGAYSSAADGEKAKKDDVDKSGYQGVTDLTALRAFVIQIEGDIIEDLELTEVKAISVVSATSNPTDVGGEQYDINLEIELEDGSVREAQISAVQSAKGEISFVSNKKAAYSSAADGEKVKKDEVDRSDSEPCDSTEVDKLQAFVVENEDVIIAELELTNVKAISVESANSKATVVGGVSYDIQLKIELEDGSIDSASIMAVKSSKGVISFVSNKKGAKYSAAADKGKKEDIYAEDFEPCSDSDEVSKVSAWVVADKDEIVFQLELTNVKTLSVNEDGVKWKLNAIGGASYEITLKVEFEDGTIDTAAISAVKSAKGVYSLVSKDKGYNGAHQVSDLLMASSGGSDSYNGDCICTTEYDPFCCEGETFDNACNAQCAGHSCPKKNCKQGTCDSQTCACPFIYQPLCCNDETYPNSCTAQCVGIDNPLETCTAGKCEEDDVCACTREFNPYCCEDTTYPNPCEARCDGHSFINFKCKKGVCESDSPCYCPAIFDPVCCNKGTDQEAEYANSCNAACDLSDGSYSKSDGLTDLLSICERGACQPDEGCICTLEWDPVCCGSKTFGNMCQASCDGYDNSQCKTGGSCQDFQACTMEYMPLCCWSNTYYQTEFDNPCMAEKAGVPEPAEDQSYCQLGECDSITTCTAEYAPLCCDGTTYGNECFAKSSGYIDPINDCKSGRCDHSICTSDWKPLCCQGTTYANQCMAQRNGVIDFFEECVAGSCEDQLCACPAVYRPVCCLGDKDFDNICTAQCNGFNDATNQCQTGTCGSGQICTLDYDPYCCGDQGYGTKGTQMDGKKTYGNACMAEYAGFDDPDNNAECQKGSCDQQVCACTLEYNPLCCDGIDYSNPCAAECDGVPYPAESQTPRCEMGQCKDLCACTLDYNPVCCGDKDYSNPCSARCDGVSNPDSCSTGKCSDVDKECICTREYKPLCCDGVDFGNECLAKCNDITDAATQCTLGECDGQCICTNEYAPVCCTRLNGDYMVQKEFSNECAANCVGFDVDKECSSGLCDDVGLCTAEYRPFCCDDETYSNPCLAKQAGFDNPKQNDKCTKGQCDNKECVCDRSFDPVCCDGVDYDNVCTAQCDGWKECDKVCSKGKCDSNVCICTLEWDPLCCDGKQYSNNCHAECAGIDSPSSTCDAGLCSDGYCACDRSYQPLCCDGKDYSNPCLAECDGIDKPAEQAANCMMGQCKDQNLCICTKEYNPQCCTDDDGNKLDYSNPCLAGCDGIKNPTYQCQPGKCEDDSSKLCQCTKDYKPQCCDGTDYSNPCLAECDGITNPLDTCKPMECDKVDKLCQCTKDLKPYCCGDQDYDNACLARCDGQIAPEYFCKKGTCADQPKACTMESNPICCDGKNYANPCFAETNGGYKEPAEDQDECTLGECSEVCKCTREINPICCDDKDFANPCLAECGGFDDAQNSDQCDMGLCKFNSCSCTRQYSPMCCDGKDFSNPCIAECNGFDDALKNEKCSKGRCDKVNTCTYEWNPYCCADKTYSNPCLALIDGGFKDVDNNDKCTKGECTAYGKCSSEYQPFCCSKVTYESECDAVDGGFDDPVNNEKCKNDACSVWGKKNGEKGKGNKDVVVCTMDFNPICCEDKDGTKTTFSNPCIAETEGGIQEPAEDAAECTMGECDGDSGDLCKCSKEFVPVCCNEKDDYDNQCLAQCDLKLSDSEFAKVCTNSSCESNGCECTKEIDPWCCDGKTFDNECVAKCNGIDCTKSCIKGTCVDYAASAHTASYDGIFSLGSTAGSSQWNIMIVIIQLCILAVCCLSLGLSISFCFKNPNRLFGAHKGFNKVQSFGHDQ